MNLNAYVTKRKYSTYLAPPVCNHHSPPISCMVPTLSPHLSTAISPLVTAPRLQSLQLFTLLDWPVVTDHPWTPTRWRYQQQCKLTFHGDRTDQLMSAARWRPRQIYNIHP